MRASISEVAQPGGGVVRVAVQPLRDCPTVAAVILLAPDGAAVRALGALKETPAGWTATPVGGKPKVAATRWAAVAALTQVPTQWGGGAR